MGVKAEARKRLANAAAKRKKEAREAAIRSIDPILYNTMLLALRAWIRQDTCSSEHKERHGKNARELTGKCVDRGLLERQQVSWVVTEESND